MNSFCSLIIFYLLHIVGYLSVSYFMSPRDTLNEFLSHLSSWIMQLDIFYSLHFLLLAYFFLFGTFNPWVPLLITCLIHVTFSIKTDVIYFLQIFWLLAYMKHLTPGRPYWILVPYMLLLAWKWMYFIFCNFFITCLLNPCPTHVTFSMKMDVFYTLQFFYYLLIWSIYPWANTPSMSTEAPPSLFTFSMKNGYILFFVIFLLLAYLEHLTPG